ncbi:MAG: ABC transporter ATP-binding protein [Sulfolobales archaeon]
MALLEVKNLKIYYYTPAGVVRAVDGVDLYLERGESLCIVGESGSGKSTLGLGIAGLIEHPGRVVDGEVWFDGELVVSKTQINTHRLLGKKITMIFQDPRSALNPVMRIGEQIVEMIMFNLGIDRSQAYRIAYELLQSVEIPDPKRVLDSYPHELSGGMAQRVVIAIAISTKPELVIADEPTSALDVTIQAQILKLLRSAIKDQGRSLIFITHDLSVALEICDRTLIMYAGKIVEEGLTKDIFIKPLHPYTSALLNSIPKIGSRSSRLPSLPGEPPQMTSPPKGCRFHPRCPARFEPCDNEEPPMFITDNKRRVACFLYRK